MGRRCVWCCKVFRHFGQRKWKMTGANQAVPDRIKRYRRPCRNRSGIGRSTSPSAFLFSRARRMAGAASASIPIRWNNGSFSKAAGMPCRRACLTPDRRRLAVAFLVALMSRVRHGMDERDLAANPLPPGATSRRHGVRQASRSPTGPVADPRVGARLDGGARRRPRRTRATRQ